LLVIRLVLFDIDGTLIHSGGAGVKAFARAFASEFNVANGTEKMKFAGRTDTGLVREFFQTHQIEATPENFRRFFDCYIFWLDHLLGNLRGGACKGAREFVDAIRLVPNPPTMGLLTGNIRLGAELKLRHYDLWEAFVVGAFGDDHHDRNQLARIARQRGSRLVEKELHGEEILVIGDTPFDIECGKAIDARVLAVATGGAPLDQLQSHAPTWAVRDLTEISAREVCC
jgi:phosphoglycolate phosphatase